MYRSQKISFKNDMKMKFFSRFKRLFSKRGKYWFKLYVSEALGIELSERNYLDLIYACNSGKHLNLENPKTFNDKLNWLKLNDRNPLYSKMVDKYEAKAIAARLIGEEYIVPCYGVWNSFDEIDFDKLPDQFVLKTTHDSSGAVLCKDKASFDKAAAKKAVEESLNNNYYFAGFEWPYDKASHRVLADKLLIDGKRKELQDYKWWCFNGVPKVMYITNKGALQQCEENFYDMDFKPLDIQHGFPRTVPEYDKPEQFEKMKELAGILAQDLPFIRVDFFVVDGKIYFGEFTFFDHAGLRPFADNGWDEKLGSWIILKKE